MRIAAVLINLVLLITVILQSCRRGVPMWKDSQVWATLALDLPTRTHLDRLDVAQVREVSVRLDKRDQQWALRDLSKEGFEQGE